MPTVRVSKRVALIGLVLVSLIISQVGVIGQTRRSGVRQQPRGRTQPTKASITEVPRPNSKLFLLTPSPKSQNMAAPFRSGKLPEPLRKPAGSPDEVAATLAKQIGAGDDQSVAALLTAILTVGFGVRDEDGALTQTQSPGQGIAIGAWEVAAMAKMYGDGHAVKLSDLSLAFTSNIPELRDVPLATLLLKDIRTNAQSAEPLLRFTARFIAELGRRSPEPYDMLAPGLDVAKVRLDPIQMGLILKRLAGDIAAFEDATQSGISPTSRREVMAHAVSARRSYGALFAKTAMNFESNERAVPSIQQQNPSKSPCPLGEIGELIVDINATATTSFFGAITEGTKWNRAMGRANIVATVVQFLWVWAALEIEIEMDGPHLERTKDTNPGQRRKLTAKIRLDIPEMWKAINCIRPLLNSAGLDLSLPGGGELGVVEVDWELELGGDIVNFPWNGSSKFSQLTDEKSVASIFIEGIPQKEDLTKKKHYPVDKRAIVELDTQIKTFDLFSALKILSTSKDYAGPLISLLSGDRAGGYIGLILETLYRAKIFSSKPFIFLVKDWESCDGGWSGTITYKETFKDEGEYQNRSQVGNWNRDEYYEATIEVTGVQNGFRASGFQAVVKARADQNETRSDRGVSKVLCNLQTDTTSSSSGNASAQQTVNVIFTPDGRYRVSYWLPHVEIIGLKAQTRKLFECKNPFIKIAPNSMTPLAATVNVDAPKIEDTIDPNNPNLLKGSKPVTIPVERGTRTGILTWNLVRCGSQ